MKKIIFILGGIFMINVLSQTNTAAQQITTVEKKEVYNKEHIPKKDPLPYPFVREADVMWEKVVWRSINLREKMNHSLYFPTEAHIGDRRSLVRLFLDVLENQVPGHPVYAYSPWTPTYEFEQIYSLQEIYRNIKIDSIREPVVDSITGQTVLKLTSVDIRLEDVSQLFVKEKWYFDRKYSTLNVRIIGICPVRVYPMTIIDQFTGIASMTGDIRRTPLFWVYYPEVRYYLARQEAYNPHNDAQPISFDDIFQQRLFSSYIYKESNVFNNRQVDSYNVGLDKMFEAERIKHSIFEFEHDLWEY
jgi:gliding motility associated protien GldN